jgi:uncharacterized membrane protein
MLQAPHDDTHSAPRDAGGERAEDPSDVSRWLAALSYAFVVAVFVIFEARRRPADDFLRFHARQGFLLFFAEFALLVVSMILNHTVGRIEVLGFVIMVTWNLVTGLLAVGVSVMGFMYALSGERWKLPVLGDHAGRVPIK